MSRVFFHPGHHWWKSKIHFRLNCEPECFQKHINILKSIADMYQPCETCEIYGIVWLLIQNERKFKFLKKLGPDVGDNNKQQQKLHLNSYIIFVSILLQKFKLCGKIVDIYNILSNCCQQVLSSRTIGKDIYRIILQRETHLEMRVYIEKSFENM